MRRILNMMASCAMALCLAGCIHTADIGDNRPVAPDAYSTESSEEGDPELPPMVPWWMD